MSDSLNNKELVAVGHQFAKAMSTDTAIIDIAKIVSRLAERLDCTIAALHASQAQRDQLAAENGVLKITGKDVVDHWRAAGLGKMKVEMMKCMPELRKALEIPATDAFLAEVRASAVEEFVRMADYYESVVDGEIVVTPNSVFAAGHEFAAQLRQEAAQ